MKIKRVLYTMTDVNGNVTSDLFMTMAEAQANAKSELDANIKKMFGNDYVVPAESIDADGYIDHLTMREEISSAEWGWTIYDGVSDCVRASIDEIEIELSTTELEDAFRERDRFYLLEDARNALHNKAGFVDYDENSESNEEAKAWFAKTYGFTLEEAEDSSSVFYVLGRAVSLYEDYEDQEICANATWESAIDDALHEVSMKART